MQIQQPMVNADAHLTKIQELEINKDLLILHDREHRLELESVTNHLENEKELERQKMLVEQSHAASYQQIEQIHEHELSQLEKEKRLLEGRSHEVRHHAEQVLIQS